MEKYKEKEWLEENYYHKKRSAVEMGHECGVSTKTITNWMERFGLKRRTGWESSLIKRENHVVLSEEAKEFIYGELLGDGSLYKHETSSPLYKHGSKYKSYLRWLAKELSRFGVDSNPRFYKINGFGITWLLVTRAYVEFNDLRAMWYPEGKKIVPENIELTPLMARQWYIGDGWLSNTKNKNSRIGFATDGFSRAGVQILYDQLQSRGFRISMNEDKKNVYRLYISAHSTHDFLEWIGPCPEQINDIYGYKWKTNPYVSPEESKERSHKLNSSAVRAIRALRQETVMTQADVARKFGISRSQVSNVGNRKEWAEVR